MAQDDLKRKFPQMTPNVKPPSFTRINGCGLGLYGKRDYDEETRSYVATCCISLVYVPCVALKAYRVEAARNGWYFLGREPLSTFAKSWNLVLLATILCTVGLYQYVNYTNSSSYIAGQKMAAAHHLVDQGQLAKAAKIYQPLAIANADQTANATAALKDLVDNRCAQAPLSEAPVVFQAASQVAHHGGSISVGEVADKGMKLAAANGNSDPRSGVALLDVIRPLIIDTRPVDDLRLTLLRKWNAQEPANLDAIVPLASLLEQQDQLDEAKKLLMPVKDKLGDGEGARVLGVILGHEGDLDGAYALLWPYVQIRLDRLHSAEKASNDTADQLWKREVDLLDQNKGPQDFYDRYKTASPDAQRAMVQEYVNGKIKNDPQYTGAEETLVREAAVVPVTLELGIVMVQRAQSQTDPAARKAQLESAEKVFLGIGGFAGETDQYRLSLGQVYYWLGKRDEGRKLFDEYLTAKGRDVQSLISVGQLYRLLGSNSESRAMSEEAYNKASKDEDKYAAAGLRTLNAKDLDDRIAWMGKTDLADPANKAELAKSTGDKAFQQGNNADAVSDYRKCIEIYSSMPRNSTTVNETALACYSLFQATGDHADLERCQDYFQQAVNLDPSNSILLYNAGATLLGGALEDIIGKDIDLHALRMSGDISLLGYLYSNDSERKAIVQRVKDHPGVARALSYLEKVLVLAPKNADAYEIVYGIRNFTRDDAGLNSLADKLKTADLDTGDSLNSALESISGAKDEENKVSITSALKRGDEQIKALGATGGRTLAVALDRQVEQMRALDGLGGTVDADQVLSVAMQAQQLNPSSHTNEVLISTHVFHAIKDLRRSSLALDAFCKKYQRSVADEHLLAVALSEPSDFRDQAIQNPEVQKTLSLMKENEKNFSEFGSGYEWATFSKTDPAQADAISANVRKLPRLLVEQSILLRMYPWSTDVALENYWMMQIAGSKPEESGDALKRVAGLGISVPIQLSPAATLPAAN